MPNPIGWCEQTLNPLVGCTHAGAGCDHCYAERMARRLNLMGSRGYDNVVDFRGWTGRVSFIESELQKPLKRRKPTIYFMVSMGDMFHRDVVDMGREWLDTIFATMALCPQHKFIVLTKRIDNAREYLKSDRKFEMNNIGNALSLPVDNDIVINTPWPLPNVQLLVSIWDQESADAAIPVLLETPAAVRGVSIEPMLGPIVLPNIECLDRIILGGENGPGARPMHPDWVRSVRDKCVGAGVPFWFKGWGEWLCGTQYDDAPLCAAYDDNPEYSKFDCMDWNFDEERYKESGGMWCDDLSEYAVFRVGRKRSGHMLDGREWRETVK